MHIQKSITELINSKIVFTDLMIRTGERISVKTPTGWAKFGETKVERDDFRKFMEVVAGKDWLDKLKNHPKQSIDVAKTIGGAARLRFNISFSAKDSDIGDEPEQYDFVDEVNVTIRKLSLVPPEFKETGLPDKLLQQIINSKGLWIITGPTGNGKSTTIASILQYVNTNQSKHIVTIEEPIEYILRPSKSIISQKEVGLHTPTFDNGLVASLRQRPDIIMIGEVRDKLTMETMMQAGESGHLVLGTLHTKNAPDAISKMIGLMDDNNSANKINTLASTLNGVIAQNLLPSADGNSLVLAYEILINNPEIQNIIRKQELQKLPNALMTSKQSGCVHLNDSLKDLMLKKRIKESTAEAASYDKEALLKGKYL